MRLILVKNVSVFWIGCEEFFIQDMKVIKNINNNIAHCVDSKGREVIAFGKGIGFYKTDEEIPLNKINRTFYNVKDTDYGILRSIPTVIINTAIYIIDLVAEELSVVFPSSSALTLADHLQFAIERKDKNIYLEPPLLQDIAQLYPDEMKMAMKSLKIIEKMTGEKLPRMEAGTLAMHFVTDRINTKESKKYDTVEMTEHCTKIIEEEFHVKIDRESFNYSRFATHLDYLIRRLAGSEQIESKNQTMFSEVVNNYPDSYNCAIKICGYLAEQFDENISNEEILYLVIHINRLISRV